jgi:hypothetical protein
MQRHHFVVSKLPREEKDSDDEGKGNLQPDPGVMILLLFDAQCLCAVVVVANEAIVKISSTRDAAVAAPLLSSS